MAMLEKLAVISKSLVSNVRPAEKSWKRELNQQSALEQYASTKIQYSYEQTVSMDNMKRGIIVHYYCSGYSYRVSDTFFAINLQLSKQPSE